MTAIENLVIPMLELAMKSVNASSGHRVGSVVLDPDQRDFSRSIGSLQMIASSRINSHTDLNRIDETRGNFTVEGGELLVNEKNIDRQTHAHHSYALESLQNLEDLRVSISNINNNSFKKITVSPTIAGS